LGALHAVTENFAALGEFHAHLAQARQAAGLRYAKLRNLAAELHRAADAPEADIDHARLSADLAEARQAEGVMRQALARANDAGVLCGERPRSARGLLGAEG
jgi:hypothetical protein